MLNNKSLLITGGTGSFGKYFVKKYFEVSKNKRLILNDELKQFEMSKEFTTEKYPCLRYFLGDIRDNKRLRTAFEGIDIVVHAAALKQVPTVEYNPMEYIKKLMLLSNKNIIDVRYRKKC